MRWALLSGKQTTALLYPALYPNTDHNTDHEFEVDRYFTLQCMPRIDVM